MVYVLYPKIISVAEVDHVIPPSVEKAGSVSRSREPHHLSHSSAPLPTDIR